MDTAGDKHTPTRDLRLAGRFLVDRSASLARLGGAEAFPASDVLSPGGQFVALAPRYVPANFETFTELRHECLLPLLLHEVRGGALWALAEPPLGTSLQANLSIWQDALIISDIIRPLGRLLEYLHSHGLTARCIRPDNVFIGPHTQQVMLGPLGLTAPAADQPVAFESLSSAVCEPAARGAGTIADDVFSLGVLAVTLSVGRLPFGGMTDEQILTERFAVGSPDAYMRDGGVSPAMRSLLKAMLSDDPSQRPTPAELAGMTLNKFFSVRVDKRARVPLVLGGTQIRTVRALAWYGARHSDEFIELLRRRTIEHWLLREMDQIALAKNVRQESSSLMSSGGTPGTGVLSRVLHVLDPDAPLYRLEQWFSPDAIPAMLAHEAGANAAGGAMVRLAAQTLDRESDLVTLSDAYGTQLAALAARIRRIDRHGAARFRRLIYDVNQWQCCLSPICREDRLLTVQAVIQACDRHATQSVERGQVAAGDFLLDEHLRAFLESACFHNQITPTTPVSASGTARWMADLRLLGLLQRQLVTMPMPGMARFVLPLMVKELDTWRSADRRRVFAAQLERLATKGDIGAMLDILQDRAMLLRDHQEALEAEQEFREIVDQLANEERDQTALETACRESGQFIALLAAVAVSFLSFAVEVAP